MCVVCVCVCVCDKNYKLYICGPHTTVHNHDITMTSYLLEDRGPCVGVEGADVRYVSPETAVDAATLVTDEHSTVDGCPHRVCRKEAQDKPTTSPRWRSL